MARPAAQLLGNGDILVPVEGAGMTRLHPDEAEYEEVLARIQDSTPSLVERALTFWGVGLLLVFAIPVALALLVLLAGGVHSLVR